MEPLRFLPCRVSSLLATTVAAAIAVSQYNVANALTAQEIAPLTISTADKSVSPLVITIGNQASVIFPSQQEDPPPPQPSKAGGSRVSMLFSISR
jgi:hypothetical protein